MADADEAMGDEALEALQDSESNPVAVVTGASSGIGMATALKFAEEGYNVVLAARRLNELQEVVRQCEQRGVEAMAVETDTSDAAAQTRLCEEAVASFGFIDVWVNNAGVYLVGKFEDVPLEDARKLMDTNFFGYVYGSRAALEQFRSQGFGTLINVSSVNATAPQPYISIYSASKAAVRALDESIRMELQLENLADTINICTVMPASVDTNLFQNGANYTGRKVQALQPVYDPEYAAHKIVKLAEHPKRELIIGPVGRLLALQNAHSPRMYENRMGRYTDADLLGEDAVLPHSGNLYGSIAENRGMRGGWREQRARADYVNAGVGLIAAGLLGLATVAGVIAYRRNQNN